MEPKTFKLEQLNNNINQTFRFINENPRFSFELWRYFGYGSTSARNFKRVLNKYPIKKIKLGNKTKGAMVIYYIVGKKNEAIKRIEEIKKICIVCRQKFVPHNINHFKYCSKKCQKLDSKNYHNNRNKEKYLKKYSNRKCFFCGITKKLEIHHLFNKKDRFKNRDKRTIPVCNKHHKTLHKYHGLINLNI